MDPLLIIGSVPLSSHIALSMAKVLPAILLPPFRSLYSVVRLSGATWGYFAAGSI